MEWLAKLFGPEHSVAVPHAALVLSLVASLGLLLGGIRIFKINLGIAGVLFAGLFFGHFKAGIDKEILEFVREFGLILFVYTIGMQVGPGFFASLRKQGLPLAACAAAIVTLGTLTALCLHYIAGISMPVAAGLLSGATTNTPSLGAAQQALREMKPELAAEPGLGYAIAYPFGILGIIITMQLVRRVFKIDIAAEQAALAQAPGSQPPALGTINLEVDNPNIDGLQIKQIPVLRESGVVISRLLHEGEVCVPRGHTVVSKGDILLAVGPKEKLDEFRLVIGRESTTDLRQVRSGIVTEPVIVTHKHVLGKSIQELGVLQRYGVTITRVARADIEFTPAPSVRLQFGDKLMIVGERGDIARAAKDFGNSPKELTHPILAPVFLGIALGVIFGSWPANFRDWGLPIPVKLGLAGGPLVIAILLSRLSNIGPFVWYMPISANLMLREVGIVLFLACVGLHAGDQFAATLVSSSGLHWLLYGALITIIPLLIVGFFARAVMKLNYLTLCGVLAGSMTDPPALAFANSMAGSDAPGVSYATVYPLTMLLRVFYAQILVLVFM